MAKAPETTAETGTPEVPARKSRLRPVLFLVAAGALFGGGFWGGQMLYHTLFSAGEVEAPVAVAKPEPVDTDLGRMAIHLPDQEAPWVLKVSASVLADKAPEGEAALRDAVHGMIVSVVEAPLVSADLVTREKLVWAIMAIAPQEAPWLAGITLTELQQMPG